MKKSANLNNFELFIYLFGWCGGVFYGVYNVYLQTSTYFKYYNDIYEDFSPGWKLLGGKRDNADQEWKLWIPLIYKTLPWALAHIFGGQIIKCYFNSMILCCWYILISLTFLLYFLGIRATVLLLIHPIFSWLFLPFQSKTLLWTLHLSCLVIMNAIKNTESIVRRSILIGEDEYTILMVVLAWTQLRTICFSLEIINDNSRLVKINGMFNQFAQILAYCTYLPTFYLGQLILYEEFVRGINKPFEKWNFERFFKVFLNLWRYFFWIYLTDFSLHFVYFNILHYHPELVRNFNSWALYGFGYCMGQFFSNKYVVVYGISAAFAKAENIADLHTPKCIGRIHLYSDMWKHFDRGLHKFLVRYIYLPVAGTTSLPNKIFASFLCFSFIYAWHGTHMFVFIWSVLNFIGLTIETLSRAIGRSEVYEKIESKLLGPRNARRFYCALASPLLAMSAISNFYFFGGQEIGNLFIQRIFSDSWISFITLLSILYCCCQISTELKNREIINSHKIKIS